MVLYDQGDTSTIEFKGIPPVAGLAMKGQDSMPNGVSTQGADEGETEGTTNKSGLEDEVGMGLECDGQMCYPKFF